MVVSRQAKIDNFIYFLAKKFHYDHRQIRDLPFAFAMLLIKCAEEEAMKLEKEQARLRRSVKI